jgi:peptidoglycan/LPS O-acetylase OafA/YrhL
MIHVSGSTAKHKLEGIEAARGIAAALVVVYHAARHLEGNGLGLPWAAGIEKFGHAGVDFFFVLSGFIILFAHWHDVGVPAALPRYAERRCTRIYPLYWPVLAVSVALAMLGSREAQPSLGMLLANTLLIPTAEAPLLGVAWTLQHEMLFYALFAPLLWSRSWGIALLAIWMMWALAVSGGVLDRPDGGLSRVASSAYNVQFALGMAAAWITRRVRVPQAGWLALLGAASFFAVGVAESLGSVDGYGNAARLLYGVAAWLFVMGIVERERATSLRVPRLLALLGKASYSIYLVHLLCLGVAYKVFERLGATRIDAQLLLAVLVASGIAGGVLVSTWIEYPLMARARKLWSRAAGEDRAVAS